ncbi:MAG: nitrous oxide reductase accessory protein NosL [Ignavibacteria bacterium]|nr:nitrous oxide reductase accessory protein NosL [Ignavibacteria bacterium]
MNTIILLLSFIITIGCQKEILPIDYGKDQCSHCKMTIVDKKYGAEIVTAKGKAYKFDATECLIGYLTQNNLAESDLDKVLVTDLSQPEKLIDATTAVFLISPKLRSPMGENISSFSDKKTAEKFREDFGGDIYDWQSLKQFLINR